MASCFVLFNEPHGVRTASGVDVCIAFTVSKYPVVDHEFSSKILLRVEPTLLVLLLRISIA